MQIHLIGIRDSGFGIHSITAVSVIDKLSSYVFTLWGRDLVSVVRITESPSMIEGFLKENMRTFCRDIGNCP